MANKVILLVEDNPDDEALTLRALKRGNLVNEIVVARDGAEALDYLFGAGAYAGRRSADTPAVVLLDLKLPKLDGIDVLQRIRGHADTRYIPVVVLTSSSEDEDVLKSYRNGANSYVRKPVAFADFTAAVSQVGVYWVLLNRAPGPE